MLDACLFWFADRPGIAGADYCILKNRDAVRVQNLFVP
jgi:hypothetical protein